MADFNQIKNDSKNRMEKTLENIAYGLTANELTRLPVNTRNTVRIDLQNMSAKIFRGSYKQMSLLGLT